MDLTEIRLTEIQAAREAEGAAKPGPLKPSFTYKCVPTKLNSEDIEVSCTYDFIVSATDVKLVTAQVTYRVFYKLNGDEPVDPSDVDHFARANGAYHTWPFVRETIYSLTSRMGFPPYTLPVLSFLTGSKPKDETPAPKAAEGTTMPVPSKAPAKTKPTTKKS